MTRNALTLTGSQEKYAHIFDTPIEREHHVPSNEEMFAAENEASRLLFAQIFGLPEDTPQEEIMSFLQPHAEEVAKANGTKADPVPESELRAKTAEDREREYVKLQNVYIQAEAEKKDLTTPGWSKSTDTVVEPVRTDDLFNRARETVQNGPSFSDTTTKSSGTHSYAGSSSTSSSSTGPRKAIDEFQRMNKSVQQSGAQRSRIWNEKPKMTDEEYFAQFASNVPWWKKQVRKGKRFLKTGKGRITMKMGVVILLQLSMAVYGKKFEFESKQQMFAMFTMMLASFFMTRELSEEGIDVTGMIF